MSSDELKQIWQIPFFIPTAMHIVLSRNWIQVAVFKFVTLTTDLPYTLTLALSTLLLSFNMFVLWMVFYIHFILRTYVPRVLSKVVILWIAHWVLLLTVLVCYADWFFWSSRLWALVNWPLQRGQLYLVSVFCIC